MRAWILIAAVGCESGTRPPRAPEQPAPLLPVPLVADAAVVAVADAAVAAVAQAPADASIDAPARVDVRPAVRAAPPWIARMFILTPKISTSERLVTYVLRRESDQALITRESTTLSVMNRLDGASPPATPATEEWRLSVVQKGNTLTFAPLDGGTAPFRECKRTTISVVGATAELRLPREDDCGGTPRWRPATTKRVAVLRCDAVAFAPAPGVEWVDLHGDCIVGEGWRAIPKDGSVSPP